MAISSKRKRLDVNKILKRMSVNVPKALEKRAKKAALKKAKMLKEEAIREFDRHEVTKEIEKGPSGRNSRLLGGKGNFFGFLGFEKNSNPIIIVRDALENSFNLSSSKGKLVKVSKNTFKIKFDIQVPNDTEIYSITPLPWTSKSWVRGVEKGITNYAQTIFQQRKGSGFLYESHSRSGVALQTKRNIGFITFRPTPYITNILDKIRKQL